MHNPLAVTTFFTTFSFAIACLPGIRHVRRDEPSFDNIINDTPTPAIRTNGQIPNTGTALVNVRVFDGYAIQPPSTVFLYGGNIATGEVSADTIVDGQGGILLPGLIDSHCHPSSIADLQNLSRFGVTTALSMSCQDYGVCNSLRDQVGLTSYFTAGWAALGPNSSHANMQHATTDRLIWSPSQVPSWVENVFSNGSDYLKITAEENGPDQATQNELVAYTHARGKRTMTHAADYASYMQAIASKSDGLQHIPFDGIINGSSLAQMMQQKQSSTPTMNLYKIVLPSISTLYPEDASINVTEAYSLVQENVRNQHAQGIPILAGTDSVNDPTYPFPLPFGISVHDELENFVEIGFSPAEAIRSATLMPALVHGLNGRGVIAPGMRADLILLQPGADPIDHNISDTKKIARVWNGGIEYTDEIA